MDRQGCRYGVVVLLAFLGLCGSAGMAMAVVPQGNLLQNGNGESDAGVTDTTTHVCPFYWVCQATVPDPANATSIRYGTPGVAGTDASAAIGGGLNFFAGGPSALDWMSQTLVLLDAAAEIDAGQVQVTISGALGGFGTEGDSAVLSAFFRDGNGIQTSNLEAPFVSATTRQNQTKLVPVTATGAVPPGTRSIVVRVLFRREFGTYADGYADNISLTLKGPDVPAPPSGSGSNSTQVDKTAATLSFAGGGTSQKIASQRAVIVKVASNEAAALSASGTLTVPGASKVFKLGKATGAVGPGQSKKLKLKISRKTARAVKRALKRKRKVRANVTIVAVDTAGNNSTIKRKIKAKR